MSTLAQTLERTRDVTKRLLERLRETHRRHYEDRPELIGANSLLAALEVIVADARRHFEDEYRQAAGQDEVEQDETRALIAGEARNVADVIGNCLSVLNRAHGRRFDPFIRPFARLARMVAPDTELLVNPISHAGSYEVTIPLNRDLPGFVESDMVGAAVREQVRALPKLVILRYPENEEHDSFHHLLLGHEIAHLALRTGGVGDRLGRSAYEAFRTQADASELEDQRGRTLSTRSLRWFIELACDRLGVKLVGPALYIALFEYALLRDWQYPPDISRADSHYNNYPALAWRLAALNDVVDTYFPPAPQRDDSPWPEILGLFATLRAAVPDWEDEDADRERAIVAAALEELRTSEDSLLAERYDLRRGPAVPTDDVAGYIGQHAHYTPEQFRKDIPAVWWKVSESIVPCERVLFRGDAPPELARPWSTGQPWSLPIDWRSVLNGVYFHWYVNRADAHSADGDAVTAVSHETDDRVAASALARGGVELSEIHLQAIDLRDELKALSRKAH